MKEMNEAMVVESVEISTVVETREQIQVGAAAMEQMEMDAFSQAESTAETQEQQEMDAFENNERMGMKTVYYPDGEEMREEIRSGRGRKLGEYRIFADTRPSGSRYDIFADGDGK